MKFKKLLFGLAASPFLLASCSNALSFEATQRWVSEHYKKETPCKAFALTEWVCHGNVGNKSWDIVNKIFNTLGKEESEEGLTGLLPTHVDSNNPDGHKYNVDVDKLPSITPLNSTNFTKQYTNIPKDDKAYKDDVYKINNGCLSATYKYREEYEESKTIDTTRIRVYNQNGLCTDFGCKIDGKWLDDDNTIKFKVLIHFTYSDDPVN